MIATFLAKPAVKYGALAIAVVALVGITAWTLRSEFSKGHAAGGAAFNTTVQQKTIEAHEKARREREQVDENARSTPYDDRVDGLRCSGGQSSSWAAKISEDRLGETLLDWILIDQTRDRSRPCHAPCDPSDYYSLRGWAVAPPCS